MQVSEKDHRYIGTRDDDQSIDRDNAPVQRDYDVHCRGANGILDPTESVHAAIEVTFIDFAPEGGR